MNKNIVRALFDDALAQVLDNIGFRMLAILFLMLVLPTFLVGLRQDDVVILFHWRVPYEDLLSFVTSSSGSSPNIPHGELRDGMLKVAQSLLLDTVADKFGILFAVASVAFFVPRMLEKGAADTLFSKPASRFALLFSRYLAGLLFVGILSAFLVGGMYLGFRWVSDYDDPGLLWGIATLTYGFAVFHAISLTVGVFTRSTIASMLLTFIFMPFNCTAHSLWRVKDTGVEVSERHKQDAEKNNIEKGNDAKTDADAPAAENKPEESGALDLVKNVFLIGLDTAHYILPKTTDTTLIAKDLRKRIENSDKEFVDDASQLSISEAPRGFTREPRSSLTRDEGLLWIAPHPNGGGEARWTLRRVKLADFGTTRSGAVKALRKKLESDPNVSGFETPKRSDVASRFSERVQWNEKRGDETRLRRQWIFQVDEYVFTLDYDAELAWAQQTEQEVAAGAFVASVGVVGDDRGFQRQQMQTAYEQHFGWSAPLKYNAWFSIATTIGFIALVLAIGGWQLSRIDF